MKVLVTPRSFGKTDPQVWTILRDAGLDIVRNPTGGILSEDQLIELVADCEGVVIGVDPLSARVLGSAPKLKAIAKYGVGVDNIDLEICRQRGITVSRTVGANADAVADFAFALMLAVARQVMTIDRNCRQGSWQKITTLDVSGRTLGILGLGAIGKKLAKRAAGFDMRIMAFDTVWDEAFALEHRIEQASLEDICRRADFISLHLPLLPETQNAIGASQLAWMKPTAILVNTARGGLIDEAALFDALLNRRIYGAGIDAFSHEPLEDPRWYALENLVIGSHAAASTLGATEKMGRMAAQNLVHDLQRVSIL